jgi:hypothetical protein
MKNEIKIIRLITGEEILVEVTLDTGFKVTVKNPIRIVVIPNKQNMKEPTVGLAPWTEFSSDTEFTLDKQHILLIMTPIPEFVNQYQMAFSKIITPQPNLLIPKGS